MKLQFRFLPIIVLAILALLFAMYSGLLRMGWNWPTFDNLAAAHGPLMVSGFLGVLIPLERAVAIRQKWMFAVPLIAGAGWVSLFFAPALGASLLTLGSLGTLAILGVMVRREPHSHTIVMALGALAWLVGNSLWMLGFPIFQVVFWWITFLVLTIGGERLELSRVLRPTLGQIRLFSLLAAALLAGTILATFSLDLGSRLSGFALLGLSLWFLRNDLAQRNLRHPNPLTRYIAICLFGGFIWLGLSGSLFLYFGALYAGPLYDAALHTVFVGFVIAMIFGHAPIIFPAILGAQVKFYPVFYVHLALLHLSLILRILGDLALRMELRKWGGLLNEVAILLFLGLTVYSIIKGSQAK
jgi:ABC-type multidrug transport system fused ATPase/permease subunit